MRSYNSNFEFDCNYLIYSILIGFSFIEKFENLSGVKINN